MKMKKMTKGEIKHKFRQEIKVMDLAIKLNCFDCHGRAADGYEDCKMENCALYRYRLKKGNLRSVDLKAIFTQVNKIFLSGGHISRFYKDVLSDNQNLALKIKKLRPKNVINSQDHDR